MVTPLTPPLQSAWRSALSPETMAVTGAALYGITRGGQLSALDPATGAARWEAAGGYLRWLAAAGPRLYAFRKDRGLAVIWDHGASYSETPGVALSPCDESTPLSHPALDDGLVYFAHRSTLMAVDAGGAARFSTTLSGPAPFALRLWKRRQLAVVDGWGQVTLWAVSDRFARVWSRPVPGPGSQAVERPCLLVGDRLFAATDRSVRAFRFDGSALWEAAVPGMAALGAFGNTLYAAAGGQVVALDAASGAVRWSRHWLWPTAVAPRTELLAVDGAVYVGNLFSDGSADLFAARASDGLLVWQPAGAGGLPLAAAPDRLVAYGAIAGLAGLGALPLSPAVGGQDLAHDPRPLRGPASLFAGSTVSLKLKTSATVTVRSWREGAGFGTPVFSGDLRAGTHSFTWDAGTAFTAAPQFGRLVAEVTESGMTYAIASPLPVNTLPDIVGHWAQSPIELMLYHRYASGYPDLTFRPDAMVNRAESATIVAKTLDLPGPSPGFQTRFTDTAGHWAKPYIEALEEKGIVSGFQEADGTYTFRPAQPMTRAQEARILVKAYELAPPPDGFATRFTDIAGHWAESDIKALEAGGYVTGFREADGTYTYRPERLLTRAELCAMVVRIRKLTRP